MGYENDRGEDQPLASPTGERYTPVRYFTSSFAIRVTIHDAFPRTRRGWQNLECEH